MLVDSLSSLSTGDEKQYFRSIRTVRGALLPSVSLFDSQAAHIINPVPLRLLGDLESMDVSEMIYIEQRLAS